MRFDKGNSYAKNRRVLANIDHYPTPKEILEKINTAKYHYKSIDKDRLIARDKAFTALLLVCQLRIGEATRLVYEQFKDEPFRIEKMKLNKAEKYSKKTGKLIMRKHLYRTKILIPLKGELGQLGQLIKDYLNFSFSNSQERIFAFKNARAEQIVKNILGIPPHWLRAYGENLLYELFDNDLLAVAEYVQVDPWVLTKYIHRTPEKYLKKLR